MMRQLSDEPEKAWGWGLSAWSLIGMVGVFAWFLDWRLSALLVAQLTFHELGHVLVLIGQRRALTPPLFIPPFGALLVIEPFERARRELIFALAGPLFGLVASSALLTFSLRYEWLVGIHAAGLGAGINLFNMLPVPPFDGGRILVAAGKIWWAMGVILLGALLSISPNPIFALIVILCCISLVIHLKRPLDSLYVEKRTLIQAAAVFSWTTLTLWALALVAVVSRWIG